MNFEKLTLILLIRLKTNNKHSFNSAIVCPAMLRKKCRFVERNGAEIAIVTVEKCDKVKNQQNSTSWRVVDQQGINLNDFEVVFMRKRHLTEHQTKPDEISGEQLPSSQNPANCKFWISFNFKHKLKNNFIILVVIESTASLSAQQHQSNESETICCQLCGVIFVSSKFRDAHQRNFHPSLSNCDDDGADNQPNPMIDMNSNEISHHTSSTETAQSELNDLI